MSLTATEHPVVTIKVKLKEAGATSLSINKESIKFFRIMTDMTLDAVLGSDDVNFSINGGGVPSPTDDLSGTPNPTVTGGIDAKIHFKLKFQGIAKKPADALNKLRVKFRLYDENTETFIDGASDNFTASDAGIWTGDVTFNGVRQGHKYTILVKGAYHIQKKVCDEKPTETSPGTYKCIKGKITLAANNNLDFSGILLMAGDLPEQDGVVNAYDTSLIRNNLGKSTEEAVAKADVNRDGIVDTQDWSLVIAALSIRSDEL